MVLRRVAERCDQLDLAYFITGSVASGIWGESRLTLDVDVAITLPQHLAIDFCHGFPPPDWYADAESAREASQQGGQFNIIYIPEAVKADIITPADTPYNRSRFARCQRVDLPAGGHAMFAAPEDVILKKLEHFAQGASDKHLRDIAGIWRVSRDRIDLNYIEHWSAQLGTAATWRSLRSTLGM